MTSLLRRIVATFVEPVERIASPHNRALPSRRAPVTAAADAPPPRPAVVFTPPRSSRGDGSCRAGRRAAPPGRRPRRPAGRVSHDVTEPDATRPATAARSTPPSARRSPTRSCSRPTPRRSRSGLPAPGELRARARTGAALLCVWQPDRRAGGRASSCLGGRRLAPPSTPPGATTPAARRLAVRLDGARARRRPRAVGSPGSGSSRSRRRPQPRPAAASRSRERRS